MEQVEFGAAPESNMREGGGVNAGCSQFGQLRDVGDQKELSGSVDMMGPQTHLSPSIACLLSFMTL